MLTEVYAALSSHGWRFEDPALLKGSATNGGWTIDYSAQRGDTRDGDGQESIGLSHVTFTLSPPRI